MLLMDNKHHLEEEAYLKKKKKSKPTSQRLCFNSGLEWYMRICVLSPRTYTHKRFLQNLGNIRVVSSNGSYMLVRSRIIWRACWKYCFLEPVKINKDHPNENRQSLFIQNLLLQVSQPPLLAFGRNTKVGRAVQKVIVKKARILVCLDWRLLAWESWRN